MTRSTRKLSQLPGRVLSAKAPCTSSNDSLLPRSPSRKPDSHVLMTRPDRSLNPATLACLPPCSLNVCSALHNKPSCPPINPRSMPRVSARCPLSMVSEHYPWRFSPATPMIDAVENPAPRHPAPTAPPASFLRLYPNRSPTPMSH